MILSDTIAAVSSAVGPAARMIVRISGPRARDVVGRMAVRELPSRAAVIDASLNLRGMRVPAVLYCFAAPRSYTGDDLVELHLPGNPLLARLVLQELLSHELVRAAEPGEFTARAYFNGRIDLAAAEGIAATIAADNELELAAARQLMAGELARRLRPAMDQLADALALVEAGIDFADEPVDFIPVAEVRRRAEEVLRELNELLSGSARFERLAHQVRVVLTGRPNAGKSTLLNALCGIQRAVVSPVAGTTRDQIWAEAALPRGLVRIIDAAGLEELPPQPAAAGIEQQLAAGMHQRALAAVEQADVLVLVKEAGDARPPLPLPRRPDLLVLSKLDLHAEACAAEGTLGVSAVTGMHMNDLRRHLDELAFGRPSAGGSALALTGRHLQAIDHARLALNRILQGADFAAELLALDLREALDELGSILGQVTPDDVLGRVFARFCIGK